MDLNFGFYRRKSTNSRNTQQLSLENQDSWRDREVLSNGYKISEEYTEAESATKVSGRPEFYRMIEDIHAGKINAIITYEVDRLARNFTENSIIQTLSQEGKIKILVTASGKFLPEDILHLGMKSLFAVYESHQMKKKMQDGREQKLKLGKSLGGFKYGYDTKNKELVINESEAFFVKKIFELRMLGEPVRSIVKIINDLGFKNRDRFTVTGIRIPGGSLVKSSCERILQNPLYYGVISYDGEIYNGTHEAIVSKETFDAVNKKKKTFKKSLVSPLKGKVFFEGKPLTVSLIKQKHIYFHKHSEKAGEKIWYNQKNIIKEFDKNINLYKMPKKYEKECRESLKNLYEEEMGDIKRIRITLNKNHAEKTKEIDGLISMRTMGEIDQGLFMPRKNKLMSEIHDIELKMFKLTESNDKMLEYLNYSVELLCNIDIYWKKWDDEVRSIWINDITVELKIDNKKRLYIEEIPTMKAFREFNFNEWWTDRGSNPGPKD